MTTSLEADESGVGMITCECSRRSLLQFDDLINRGHPIPCDAGARSRRCGQCRRSGRPVQPYYAVLRRAREGNAYQKLIIPEVILAGLPEKRPLRCGAFGSRCCRLTIRMCSRARA